jgi:hypothetical protein
MSLIIDNPDAVAVREGFGDEEISFWDLPNQDEHFFPLDEQAASATELRELIQDRYRVTRQCGELAKLNPNKAETYFTQYVEAVTVIEKRIKKLLGNRVQFKPYTP